MSCRFFMAGIISVACVTAAAAVDFDPTEEASVSTVSYAFPPIPVITLAPLPPDYSDIPPENIACWDSWASAQWTNDFLSIETSKRETSAFDNRTTTDVTSTTYDLCDTTSETGPYTTLCDSLARNTNTAPDITTCIRISETSTGTALPGYTWGVPPDIAAWSASNEVPLPNCTPAPDYEGLCYRLHSAYAWRTDQAKTTHATGSTTAYDYLLTAEKPPCRTWTNAPPPGLATKTCKIDVSDYAVHYWPSAPQPGFSFCANATRAPGGTTTISGLPDTAVISGFTLTSPSIYHFFKGVAVSTSIGETLFNSRRGLYSQIYNISSSIPQDILTLAQREEDIWTAKPSHQGRGVYAYWRWYFGNGSYNADAMTQAPASEYFDACKRERTFDCNSSTVSQAHFRQYAAVSIRDVLNGWKEGQFQDCIWHEYYEAGQWYDRQDMYIAPGEPFRATPIVSAGMAGLVPTGTGPSPGSTVDAMAVKTKMVAVPEVTGHFLAV